jgi:hypothetical protein
VTESRPTKFLISRVAQAARVMISQCGRLVFLRVIFDALHGSMVESAPVWLGPMPSPLRPITREKLTQRFGPSRDLTLEQSRAQNPRALDLRRVIDKLFCYATDFVFLDQLFDRIVREQFAKLVFHADNLIADRTDNAARQRATGVNR